MESVGDEKRIQALFSELSFEDRGRTPRFEKLWARAEANARVPVLVMRRSVVVISAAAVFAAVCLFAASAWYRQSESQHAQSIPPQIIPTTSVPELREPQKLLSADSKTSGTSRSRTRMRQRQRIATHEVAALSNWQSPTSIFLESPTASAFSSLPQLNESARELATFLPKNNEVIKESKQ